jgi:Ca2+-binding EF-hand superfamily protein
MSPILKAALLATPLALLSVCALAQDSAGKRGGGHMMQMLRDADSNNDGAISREEVEALRVKAFQRMDRNGDGRITQDEFTLPQGGDLFARFDKNNDGKISREEMPQRRGMRGRDQAPAL